MRTDMTNMTIADPETGEITEVPTRLPARRAAVEVSEYDRRQSLSGVLRPVASAADILGAQEETRNLVAGILVEGRDYGSVPGVQKPFMQKPGAERVCAAFGVVAEFQILDREIEHDRPNEFRKRSWEWHPSIRGKKVWSEEEGSSEGLYRYVLGCRLVDRKTGIVVGEGVGSASTMESKYIDRPRDSENTVLKMAKKRAFVDATLTTFGLSEQFTQDEDYVQAVAPAPARTQNDAPPSAPAARAAPSGPSGPSRQASGPFDLGSRLGFGKYRERTWSDVIRDDPQYVLWAVEKREQLTDEARDVLRRTVEAVQETETRQVLDTPAQMINQAAARRAAQQFEQPPLDLSQPDDDLPF
jgi:hypothetical protein